MNLKSATRSLGIAAAVSFLLFGVEARAQSCSDLMNEMQQRSAYEHVMVFVAVSQANKITGSAARVGGVNGAQGGAFLLWDGTQWTSSQGFTLAGQMQFNDRVNPGSLPNTSQNLSTRPSQVDGFDVWISSNGSKAKLRNNRWGNEMEIKSTMCSDGLMYGFGTPIGNHNGGRLAMYVFSFVYLPF